MIYFFFGSTPCYSLQESSLNMYNNSPTMCCPTHDSADGHVSHHEFGKAVTVAKAFNQKHNRLAAIVVLVQTAYSNKNT